MLRRLKWWWQLPWRERAQFVALVVALAIVHGLLGAFGYVRTRRALERISARTRPREASATDLMRARRLAELAAIAGRRGLVTATCLRQALVIYTALRWRGLDPTLHLGVDRIGDRFDMHAWVALGGVALAQEPLRHHPFAPTASQVSSTKSATAPSCEKSRG